MAQFGSALDWGSSGRRFKSCQPDIGQRVYLAPKIASLTSLTQTVDPNQVLTSPDIGLLGYGGVQGPRHDAASFSTYRLAVIADVATDVCSSRARLRFASSTRIVVMCRMIEKGTR